MKTASYYGPLERSLKHPLLEKEETIILVRHARAGDRKSLDRLVSHNQKFVFLIVRRYVRRANSLDVYDLMQEGNIGLVRAVRRFDPAKSTNFMACVAIHIRREVIGALRAKNRMIRFPSDIENLFAKMRKASIALAPELKRQPTRAEAISALGDIQAHRNIRALKRTLQTARRQVRSLSEAVDPHDPKSDTLGSMVADATIPDPACAAEITDELEHRSALLFQMEESIRLLDIQDAFKRSFFRHYPMDGSEPEGMPSIAEADGVSKQCIDERLKKVWRSLGTDAPHRDKTTFVTEVRIVNELRELVTALRVA